jgi:hypothetical protein
MNFSNLELSNFWAFYKAFPLIPFTCPRSLIKKRLILTSSFQASLSCIRLSSFGLRPFGFRPFSFRSFGALDGINTIKCKELVEGKYIRGKMIIGDNWGS